MTVPVVYGFNPSITPWLTDEVPPSTTILAGLRRPSSVAVADGIDVGLREQHRTAALGGTGAAASASGKSAPVAT